MNNKLRLSLLLIALSTQLFAQDVEVTASAPDVVSIGEQFRLTISVNTKVSSFNPPDLSNFYILMGPSTSFNQSTQIINNKMTRSVSYTYTYVLQATREGEFEIGPAQVTVKNNTYKSNSLKIEVVKGDIPAAGGEQPADQSGQPGAQAGEEDLYLRVLVDRNTVYQGEHIVATVKIYSRINLSGLDNAKFPSFNGFLREDIETPPLRSLERENVNGVIYGTGVLQRVVLYPQKTGELEIDPMELECLIQQRVQRDTRSFFDDFFDSFQTLKQTIKSPPVTITVKPLPPGSPDSFNGGVGQLKMNATIDKTEVKENDAVTLKIIFSGNGNLKLLESPGIDFPPDFETYDPKITTNLSHAVSGTSGNKTFEYLVVPRHAGNFRIPPVEFTYFDPRQNDYLTLNSNEFNITVVPSGESEGITVISGLSKEDIRYIGSDIRFIKNEKIKLHPLDKTIFGSAFFYLSYIVSLGLFSILIIWRRNHIRRNADRALVRNRKAKKIARRRLKVASAALKLGNSSLFYEELLKALWGYLSDKLGIPLSELSQEKSLETLGKYSVPHEIIEDFIAVIDSCEFARFAPADSTAETESIYKKASNVISRFEQKLK
ncbi:MAG: protein BatD [Bacteroidales bacterium]|nr:MAG: protein BatD [Bacteroidales bacterium]